MKTQRNPTPRLLTLVSALALMVVVLACGPADESVQQAPGNMTQIPQDGTADLKMDPTNGTPVAEPPQGAPHDSDGQGENSTLTQRPTQTPYPPDYVKPTDLPTYTPFPTLPPPPTPDPNEPRSVEAVPTTPSPTELNQYQGGMSISGY